MITKLLQPADDELHHSITGIIFREIIWKDTHKRAIKGMRQVNISFAIVEIFPALSLSGMV
jgi:hypothetical protein